MPCEVGFCLACENYPVVSAGCAFCCCVNAIIDNPEIIATSQWGSAVFIEIIAVCVEISQDNEITFTLIIALCIFNYCWYIVYLLCGCIGIGVVGYEYEIEVAVPGFEFCDIRFSLKKIIWIRICVSTPDLLHCLGVEKVGILFFAGCPAKALAHNEVIFRASQIIYGIF